MAALAKLLGRFASRDFIYFACGLLVIMAYVHISRKADWIFDWKYAPAVAVTAYGIAHFAQEIFAFLGWACNNEMYYPKPNRRGQFLSWIHERNFGVPFLLDDKKLTDFDFTQLRSLGVDTDARKIKTMLESLSKLDGDHNLRAVLFLEFLTRPIEYLSHPMLERLVFLRHLSSIGGTCAVTASIVMIVLIWWETPGPTYQIIYSGDFPPAVALFVVGCWYCMYSFYRSAQFTLFRVLLNKKELEALYKKALAAPK